jgi:hypothetical protein
MDINKLQVEESSKLPTRESYKKWLDETRANDVEQMEHQLQEGKKDQDFYAPAKPKKQKKRNYPPLIFKPQLQKEFCEHLAILGRMSHAARAVGVSIRTVRFHEKNNPDFAEMKAEAELEYRDRIAAEVYRRAVEGWEVPIVGGRWKDEVVAHERKFSDRLLEMEAKRVDSGYREKQTISMGQQGGVIVINAAPQDAGSWRKKYNQGEVLEVSSSASPVPELPCKDHASDS